MAEKASKQKYYAVKKGRQTGIFERWSDCQKQVTGFAGASFKSFSSRAEAQAFLDGAGSLADSSNEDIALNLAQLDGDTVIAFVDGSFDSRKKRYSFGAVLLTREGEHCLSAAFADPDKLHARNVAGEIEGVRQAIDWAIRHQKKTLRVYYDYEGIEKWATGDWQAKQPLTQDYARFYQEHRQLVHVEFRHVKAHSGIHYNEKADSLAKQALEGSE